MPRESLLRSVVWAAVVASTAANARGGKPNFLFVLTDDQSWVGSSVVIDPRRPDSVSDAYRTPNVERLAARGMQFTDAYSPAPYCCPTRRALLVGQTPARHVYQRDREDWHRAYRDRLTIPRMLKEADPGYLTGHLGKWDFRFDCVPPSVMGYDVSDGPTDNRQGGGRKSSKRRSPVIEDPKLIFDLTRRAGEFMERAQAEGRPFYLQVSHYAVHLDVYSRRESLRQARRRGGGRKHPSIPFAAMTHDLDDGVGLLLDQLRELGLEETTYVMLMSDNGGRASLPGIDSPQGRNHPLRNGKGTLYEGGVRVPMFVSGPGIQAGSMCRTPVTGLDLFPTLAELSGYRKSLPDDLDGGSLVELLHGVDGASVKRANPFLIFHQAYNRMSQSALRAGEWKLVRTRDRFELFNLADDLGEDNDLASRMPDKTGELREHMMSYLASVDAELIGGSKTRPLGREKPAVEKRFDASRSTAQPTGSR